VLLLSSPYYHIWTYNPRFYSLQAPCSYFLLRITIYGHITLDSTPSRLRAPTGTEDISFGAEVHGAGKFDTKAFLYEWDDRVGIVFNGAPLTPTPRTVTRTVTPTPTAGTTQLSHAIADISIGQDSLSETLDNAEGEVVHSGFNAAFLSMRQGLIIAHTSIHGNNH
jgi:hypothetical protein